MHIAEAQKRTPHAAQVARQASEKVAAWLTKADKTALFQKQEEPLQFIETENQNPTIEVNEGETYQGIDGFGFCLTGGSAMLTGHCLK